VGASRKKTKRGREREGQIFFLEPIWQSLKDSAAEGLMTSPTAAEARGSVSGFPYRLKILQFFLIKITQFQTYDNMHNNSF